jgi:hypothetical protein
VAAEVEAAIRDSQVLHHNGRLAVLLTAAPWPLRDDVVLRSLAARLPHCHGDFAAACALFAARYGDWGAPRELLGGWPFFAMLAQSVAVLRAVDGSTVYGLPEDLCEGARLESRQPRDALQTVARMMEVLGSTASSLAHGAEPVHGRRGVLAVMLRAGRLALSAVAGGGLITTPDGRGYVVAHAYVSALAVDALSASTYLLPPADVAAGWVQEGSEAVWRLAADMARAGAVVNHQGRANTEVTIVFLLIKEEFRAGGSASVAKRLRRANTCVKAAVLRCISPGRMFSTHPVMPPAHAVSFDPVAPPGPRLAAALEGGGLQLMEALLRQAGQELLGPAAMALFNAQQGRGAGVAWLLISLLAHSPEQQAAALAASFAKAARADLPRVKNSLNTALRFLAETAFLLRSIQWQGEPSPALRQLAGLLAGVLCDVSSALSSYTCIRYACVQPCVVTCLSLTALLASHGTGAVRRAWRAQLLSLGPSSCWAPCVTRQRTNQGSPWLQARPALCASPYRRSCARQCCRRHGHRVSGSDVSATRGDVH